MRSALYTGRVAHRRHAPRPHAFRQRLFLLYLDLDELPEVFRGRRLWSVERPNVASFRRADYLGDPEVPLKQAVLERASEATGRPIAGPVRMLAHLRYLGTCFNPVTFYYCFAADGETLECVVAEITNTPWKERHAYVLDVARGAPAGRGFRWSFDKAFHVSPFHPMEQGYVWSFEPPGERLAVHMESRESDRLVFEAGLDLERRPITAGNLARCLLRHPWMTAVVQLAIHWQALRLWWKRVPFHVHPAKRAAARAATESRA